MESIILIAHVLLAIAIIALILLQQGKGADMGASFGAGASQTLFGSSGSGNFLTRMTAILAALFFVTSFGLAVFAKQQASQQSDIGIPQVENQVAPTVDDELPAIGEQPIPEFNDVPMDLDVSRDSDIPTVNE